MIVTKSFDDALFKVVPIKNSQVIDEAWNSSKADQISFEDADNRSQETRQDWMSRNASADWSAMLAAVADDLPGVVTHSGEPVADIIQTANAGLVLRPLNLSHLPAGTELFTHPASDVLSAGITELRCHISKLQSIISAHEQLSTIKTARAYTAAAR